MKNKKNLLSFFKGGTRGNKTRGNKTKDKKTRGKKTRGNKTRGKKARTIGRRRKSMRGGAYIDLPSFAGDVNQTTTASYAFNQNAGTLADPTTATNQLPSRLGGNLY